MLFAFYNNTILPSADGIMINMVVGGEVVTLRSLEESLGLIVAEMPINVSLLSLHFLLSLDWKTRGEILSLFYIFFCFFSSFLIILRVNFNSTAS